MKNVHTLAMVVLILAGLNIGVDAAFGYNLIAEALSERLYDVFAIVVGLSAVAALMARVGLIDTAETA